MSLNGNIRPFSVVTNSLVMRPLILIVLRVASSAIASPVIGTIDIEEYIPNEFKEMLEEDILDVFLNDLEFAELGEYRHKSGLTYNINAIFNDSYTEVIPGNANVGVMSTEPFVYVKTLQFREEIGPGDKLTIRGLPYKVLREEQDGTGISAIFLQRT